MVGDHPGYGHFVDLLTQYEETYSVQGLGHMLNLTRLLVTQREFSASSQAHVLWGVSLERCDSAVSCLYNSVAFFS